MKQIMAAILALALALAAAGCGAGTAGVSGGPIMRENSYFEGAVSRYAEFEYNEEGNLVARRVYKADGTLFLRFEYDGGGLYMDGAICLNETEYDENGNVSWYIEYYENGVTWRTTRQYENGVLYKMSEYDENLILQRTTTYNPDGSVLSVEE